MRFLSIGCLLVLTCAFAGAKRKAKTQPQPEGKSVAVPAVIDHNRVIINAGLSLPDGSTQTIRAWVDNGNPDLYLSRRVATLLHLAVTCNDKECSSPPPKEIAVGGLIIPLDSVKAAKIPLHPVSAAAVMAVGMNAEINLPASLLRHYDVLVDFPDRKFSIGAPGAIQFLGVSSKVEINPGNGLIQVPSKIENKKYNLALDLGSCISFLSDDLFQKLATAHSDWPRMIGAVGPASMWGADEEAKWQVMRLGRVEYGPLFLTDVDVVELPKTVMGFFEKRAGIPTMGLLGSNALMNYRVGLDYAHSMVYFDIGRLANIPDFDVVGLILRPDVDGQYTILGVADINGKPSVPTGPDGVQPGDQLLAINDIAVTGSTMGPVWSMLGGPPGQQKKLTIERAGKEFTVVATVQHFLAGTPEAEEGKKRR